ncbi:MAG: glycosyltransferase [Flavobacteriales bacterium]|nr:glycosyltransferase [Flavobacteriales bacterium]
MADSRSIVFLYTELATYFLSCVKALSKSYDGKIYVVHWPINPEAPFEFNFPENVSFKEKARIGDLTKFVQEKNPEIIVSIGWMDKDYVNVCRELKRNAHTVVTMDNQWTGGLKQKLACLVSKWVLRNKFSHIWVPGQPQKVFAEKLGFKKILLNYYCADVNHFDEYYHQIQSSKREEMPKRFLFVGRYMEHKGIYEMWKGFQNANANVEEKWELWCLGTGDEFDQRIKGEKMEHFGFVQPKDLKEYLEKTSVFVLPSRFEPWGVVVHEYAVAGFPMIVSDAVGAVSAFVKNGKNGFVYKAGSEIELQESFERIMKLSEKELVQMSAESRVLGLSLTPDIWAAELKSILN